MKVYQAINAVQEDLSKDGISKDRTNNQGNTSYKFRGIDDVYNALSPLLAKHGLCILPRMISRECAERTSSKGNALFYVTVEAEFDFVSAEDASKHTVRTFGEAMDSGDKATNKAMSAAYKYAAFQAFAIPTEGDNDADASSHVVSTKSPPSGSAMATSVDEFKRMSLDEQVFLKDTAAAIVSTHGAGNVDAAFHECQRLDNEERLAIWHLLPSNIRSDFKKKQQEQQ